MSVKLVLLLGVVLVCVGFVAATFPRYLLDIPMSYGEGPIVRDALLLANGEIFYRHLSEDPPFSLSNYPPVYYALLSLILSVCGGLFIPGRIVSFVAGLGVVFLVYRIVSVRSGDRLAAMIAALLVISSPFKLYFALNRVDATAAFFSLCALWMILAHPLTIRGAVLTAIFTAVAALTRQTAFILPLIVCVGLYGSRHWYRECVVFLLGFILLVTGVALSLEFATHGAFSLNIIIGNINSFEWERLALGLVNIGQVYGVPLIIMVFIVVKRLDDRRNHTLFGWLIFGATPSALAIAKTGSDLNYLIEMYVCLAIIFGIMVSSVRNQQSRRILLSLALVACAVPSFESIRKMPEAIGSTVQAAADKLVLIDVLGRCQGAILSDNLMGIELIVGKKIVFQPYEMNQMAGKGLWSDRKLRRALRTGRYSAVLISEPFWARDIRMERWSKVQWRLLRRRYRSRADFWGNQMYIPRSQSGFSC